MTQLLGDLGDNGTGCGDTLLIAREFDVDLYYEFRSSTLKAMVGKVRFETVIAFKFTDEMHGMGSRAGSYDTLVEVKDSSWVAELTAVEPSNLRLSARGMHHYAVFITNNGLFEFMARKATIEVGAEGTLQGGIFGTLKG